MHIVFITQEFSPYVERTSAASELVAAAKAFKQEGCEVSVTVPSLAGVKPDAHALARRLSPIRATVGDREVVARRYDGRTPDGVAVNFLDVEGDNGGDATARCAAAAALIGGAQDVPDICISFGKDLAGFSEAARCIPALAETVMLANLGQDGYEALPTLQFADRIVVARRNQLPVTDGAADRFAVIPPGATACDAFDKPSEKATLQMRLGFAVRDDVPLTLFVEHSVDALAAYLAGDVQSVVFDDRTDCAALRDRYPDRLRTVSREELTAVLGGADACVFGDDSALTAACLTRKTLPICTAREDVVDLEPSLASGTGIVLSEGSADGLAAGLSRAVSAFYQREAFQSLVARLPGYAMTWPRIVALTLGLVEEVRAENE